MKREQCNELVMHIMDSVNDLQSEDFNREGCAKAFANFLVTLVEERPEDVLRVQSRFLDVIVGFQSRYTNSCSMLTWLKSSCTRTAT